MKPKIVTRLANIFAKLAGSSDYDPSVKPLTPIEYYADQIPVTPKPGDGDNGKVPVVSDGAYSLASVSGIIPADVVRTVSQDFTDAEQAMARFNIDAIGSIDMLDVLRYSPQVIEPEDQAVARQNIGAISGIVRETVASATPALSCADNHYYKCGEVTTLEIVSVPANGWSFIEFVSGSVATVFTNTANVEGLDSLIVLANTKYQISILDGTGVFYGFEQVVTS